MFNQVRAHLLLAAGTLLLCSVLYPLAALGLGRLLFPSGSSGSFVSADDGSTVGSRLIAQEFKGDAWFQPRPSATSPAYNAAASSGSNWGANNPRLRDRVARQLGPVVKYAAGPKAGRRVGPDVERWFAGRPDRAAAWANAYPTLAAAWVTSDDVSKAFVTGWAAAHPEVLAAWRGANPGKEHDPAKPEDLAVAFFESFARAHPGRWPAAVEVKGSDGTVTGKEVRPVSEGADVQATFFDPWLQAHPGVELERVPADMVTASGSGLDPHVTLRNARYQLDRVAAAWSARPGADPARVRAAIEGVLERHAFRPLGGLIGEPLVNVFEVNLALREAVGRSGTE